MDNSVQSLNLSRRIFLSHPNIPFPSTGGSRRRVHIIKASLSLFFFGTGYQATGNVIPSLPRALISPVRSVRDLQNSPRAHRFKCVTAISDIFDSKFIYFGTEFETSGDISTCF